MISGPPADVRSPLEEIPVDQVDGLLAEVLKSLEVLLKHVRGHFGEQFLHFSGGGVPRSCDLVEDRDETRSRLAQISGQNDTVDGDQLDVSLVTLNFPIGLLVPVGNELGIHQFLR